MASKNKGRGVKGGISPRALAATAEDEAPGPGVERKPQVGIAGAGSPTGAASRRRALETVRLETVRCPLCGKLVRKHSAPLHAISHIEKLEKRGVVRIFKENGGWVVYYGTHKYFGASWTTLLCLTERLAKEGVVVSG